MDKNFKLVHHLSFNKVTRAKQMTRVILTSPRTINRKNFMNKLPSGYGTIKINFKKCLKSRPYYFIRNHFCGVSRRLADLCVAWKLSAKKVDGKTSLQQNDDWSVDGQYFEVSFFHRLSYDRMRNIATDIDAYIFFSFILLISQI